MTGKELYEAGKRRVEQWLDDVEEHGVEECLSTVYMCVTFAGLLNTIDYSPKEISKRAAREMCIRDSPYSWHRKRRRSTAWRSFPRQLMMQEKTQN